MWRQTVHIGVAKCHKWSHLGAIAVSVPEFYSLGHSRSSQWQIHCLEGEEPVLCLVDCTFSLHTHMVEGARQLPGTSYKGHSFQSQRLGCHDLITFYLLVPSHW